jgi:CheY-like chemotaxis protein
MSTPPAARYRVALEGFSDFERATLASFFRLAARREPTYVQVDAAEQSDFLIADADHREAVAAVLALGRGADTVFVGAEAPEGAMAWLTRPIEPIRIVRELDLLVALRSPATSRHARLEIEPRVPARVAALAHRPGLTGGLFGGMQRDVLVVDDSAIARKFLSLRLQRLGYRVHTAEDGEEAIDLITRQPFALAFVDVVLGPAGRVDGLRVCQYIKQRGAQGAAAMTAVVLVTGLASATDRVRGSLAGCDAYLVKPLFEDAFMAALRAVDPGFGAQPALG